MRVETHDQVKKILLFFSFSLLACLGIKAQDKQQEKQIDAIVRAIQKANIDELSNNFGSNINLTLLEDDNLYSKTQATMVMRDFFSHYPPKKVNAKSRGASKDGSSYAILDYRTLNKEHMRVVFYLKFEGEGQNMVINELRFELQR